MLKTKNPAAMVDGEPGHKNEKLNNRYKKILDEINFPFKK
jgi:hypothetical protein